MHGIARRGALLLLSLWASTRPAAAAQIKVNAIEDETKVDGFCTLREAVNAVNNDVANSGCPAGSGADEIIFTGAAAGGTITIALPNDPFRFNEDLTIKGPVTISGGGHSAIIEIGTAIELRLENLTLIDGYESGSGGALLLPSDGEVEIVNCKFQNNSADSNGGAIDSGGATLTIRKSAFEGNSANMQGGAVSAGGLLTIEDTSFEKNVANGGGAVNCTDGKLTIDHGTFRNNQAAGKQTPGGFTDGGGAVKTGCELAIANSTFEFNEAEGPFGGGAMLIVSSPQASYIEDSTFNENTANGGGAILCSFGTVGIQRSEFTLNLAKGDAIDGKFTRGGGGVMTTCATHFQDVLFKNNFALGQVGGGGLFVTELGTGNAVESVFEMNWAWLDTAQDKDARTGGGAVLVHGEFYLDRCAVTKNYSHSVHGGGGILFKDTTDGQVINTSVVHNASTLDNKIPIDPNEPPGALTLGAGIAVWGTSDVQIIASSLAHNYGTSELHVQDDGDSNDGAVILKTTLIDGKYADENCTGELDLISAGDFPHSIQASQFVGDDGDWDGGLPTCPDLPQGLIGTTIESDGEFIVGPPSGPLKFKYAKPALMSAAHGTGSPTTCQGFPVFLKDLLGKDRSSTLCTIGAVELPEPMF
jgi:CSLREA domain-containing protein